MTRFLRLLLTAEFQHMSEVSITWHISVFSFEEKKTELTETYIQKDAYHPNVWQKQLSGTQAHVEFFIRCESVRGHTLLQNLKFKPENKWAPDTQIFVCLMSKLGCTLTDRFLFYAEDFKYVSHFMING